jgi:hypothetical protein
MGFRGLRFSPLHNGPSARLVSEFLFGYNQPVWKPDLGFPDFAVKVPD